MAIEEVSAGASVRSADYAYVALLAGSCYYIVQNSGDSYLYVHRICPRRHHNGEGASATSQPYAGRSHRHSHKFDVTTPLCRRREA